VKKRAEHLKQDYIEQLVAEIRELKERIDEKYRREAGLSQDIDTFMSQYETFILKLDRQRWELENQVQRYRYKIEHFSDEESDASPGPSRAENTKSEGEADKASTQGTESGEPSLPDPGSILGKTVNEEKQRIRKYFARLWHPDRNRETSYTDENLMAQVNVAFDKTQDAADMLTVIPWHEVWVERQEGETIGAQWERLVEWKVHLSTADERLTQRLEHLTQDWRYPLYQEWKAAPSKQDYFSTLTSHARKEIQRLEETLATLQEQLKFMEQQAQEAEAR